MAKVAYHRQLRQKLINCEISLKVLEFYKKEDTALYPFYERERAYLLRLLLNHQLKHFDRS